MPVTHASCVRVPAKPKFLPMRHVRWPLLLQSCVLVQPESSTVTLDIDIREKCLLYVQNRKYSTKTICFRILHNVSIKKKKCLYIYKYCDLNFENISMDYGYEQIRTNTLCIRISCITFYKCIRSIFHFWIINICMARCCGTAVPW